MSPTTSELCKESTLRLLCKSCCPLAPCASIGNKFQPSLPKGPTLVPMAPGDGVSGTCGRAVPNVRSRSACSIVLASISDSVRVSIEGSWPYHTVQHYCVVGARISTTSR